MVQKHNEIIRKISKINKLNLSRNIEKLENVNNKNFSVKNKKNINQREELINYNIDYKQLIDETSDLLKKFKSEVSAIQNHQIYTMFACIKKEDFNIYYKFMKECEKLIKSLEIKYTKFESHNRSDTTEDGVNVFNNYLLEYDYVINNHENIEIENNGIIYNIPNVLVSMYGIYTIEVLKFNNRNISTIIIEKDKYILQLKNGEIEVYDLFIDEIIYKSKTIEKVINNKVSLLNSNIEYFDITSLIVVPIKKVSIQNNSTSTVLSLDDFYYFISEKLFTMDKNFLESLNNVVSCLKKNDKLSSTNNDLDLFLKQIDFLYKTNYLLKILLNTEKQVVFDFEDFKNITSINQIKGLKEYFLEY